MKKQNRNINISFDILSDIHIDKILYKNTLPNIKDFTFKLYSKRINKYLLVCGDIADDYQSLVTFLFESCKYYKKVVFVFGNHDLFITKEDRNLDIFYSLEKIEKLKKEKINNLYILDGDIVEIEGVKIGGTCGWYDGNYTMKNLNPHYVKDWMFLEHLWSEYIDGKYIIGFESFNEYWFKEKIKLKKLSKKVDIMLTHMLPSISQKNIQNKYKREDLTSFYCFDGKDFMKNNQMKFWIYGHTHENLEFEEESVKCINSSPFLNKKGELELKTLKYL